MTSKESEKLHKRSKHLSAPLSSDLREDYGFRSISVREGDEVRVMTGDFKGMEGEVTEVDTKNKKLVIENVETAKVDGMEVPNPVHPSNVELTKLESDEMRDKIIERRSEGGKERRKETSEEDERPESKESTEEE